jgi:exodeoxyribonuclease V beta subunit
VRSLDPIEVPLSGTTLIEASAGTGKTFTIATLYLRLLIERQLEVSQILVVTYTRAATAELRDRIRRRLLEAIAAAGSADALAALDESLARLLARRRQAGTLAADRHRLERALRDFDEAAIFTIHGFCQRALAEHAFESRLPFELELVEQEAPLLHEIAQDYWANIAFAAEPELVEALHKRARPDLLQELAGKVVRDPRMPVLPDQSAEPTLALDAFYVARDRAAALWRERRTEIVAELALEGRLNRQTHAPKNMRDWPAQLDCLDSSSPTTLPECVRKLTQESLQRATLKRYLHNPPRHAFFAAASELQAACEAARGVLEQRVLALRRAWVDYVRQQATARRRARGVQSFDDLLEQLRSALEGVAGEALAQRIRGRHPAALIDEFQDTDPAQHGIFQRLYRAEDASLFLIGDPKQAIYGFRGADIFAYMEAARAAPENSYTLDVNYRSDPRLLQATNTLFGRARHPFLFPEIRFEPVRADPAAQQHMAAEQAALQLLFVSRNAQTTEKTTIAKGWGNEQLPSLVAYEVVRLLQSGAMIDGRPVLPRDLAVLCRTNLQARNTQTALARLRVPTVLDGDSSVFESEVAEELSRVLWAVAQPTHLRKLNAALASSLLGVDGEGLYTLREDEAALELWLDRFARFNQRWHERGFVQMLHALLEECEVQAQLLLRTDGERRLTDLLHVSELLQQAAAQQHLGPLALLQWFARMREDPDARAELAAESAQLRLEHDEHALKLTTIHRSKGLEYPIVFCPFLWSMNVGSDKDVRFHDPEDAHRIKLDLGSEQREQHAKLSKREELAENLRIAYVALTRAKHRCYLVWGRFARSGLSPLGYLLHQNRGAAMPEPEDVEARMGTLDDAALLGELRALCVASEGAIDVRAIDFEPPPAYTPSEPARGELLARASERVLRALPRTTSFTRLTADPAHALGAQAEQGLDVDAGDDAKASRAANTPQPTPIVLHDFPGGARSGVLIHSVYEHIDFARSDRSELEARVAQQLALYRFDADGRAQALTSAIAQSLVTPLDGADPPLTLAAIARAQRLDELEFTLSTPEAQARLSSERLAAVFEAHAAPRAAPDYARQLRALSPLPPTGFLKGYIDLVFRHGERFYLVDYKSNHLGDSATDYAQAQLIDAMRQHHYFLQYHLYTLALHRQLALRLPDYDYDRHFGGVYYLFMRGMAPEHARGTGVFFDRPELALIEALANALGAGDGAA